MKLGCCDIDQEVSGNDGRDSDDGVELDDVAMGVVDDDATGVLRLAFTTICNI